MVKCCLNMPGTFSAVYRKGDLVIVIGTSLQVYPANQLPSITGGRTAYINYEVQGGGSGFDMVIQGKAGEILGEIDRMIG